MKQSITILGSRVKYWTYNPDKPKTILMVHGFRGTHHGLQHIVDHLPDYRIIVPDLPSFGASTPMVQHRHNIVGYRDFVETFIEKLELKKPVLLGHSFGSIVAAAVAAHQPKSISKLILINAIATPAKAASLAWAADIYYWLGQKLPATASRALLSNPLIIRFMSISLAKTKDPSTRRMIHQNHLQYFSTYQDRRALHEAYRASMSRTVSQYAPEISTPTLLIAGELDNIAPPEGQHALLSRLPSGTLVMLPGVGHLVHYEKPAQAAQAISEFIL